jgi:hypothetical protein
VYAVRNSNDEASRFKRWSAAAFYSIFNALSGLRLPPSAGDFRYMSRRVVDVLLAMPERHRFLRGMTRWVGFDQTTVQYARPRRRNGSSHYTFRRMLGLAWDGVLSFSSVPLQIASFLGFVASLLGVAYLVYVLGIRIFTAHAVPGWTSVMVAVLIIGGAQLVCLGVIGQYLARVYDEGKHRPLFVVAETTEDDRSTVAELHAVHRNRGA